MGIQPATPRRSPSSVDCAYRCAYNENYHARIDCGKVQPGDQN